MGDFLPGYVTTFANTNFNKKKANLVLVGMESGAIYGSFDTKEELLETISKKSYNNTKMCYYSPLITFTISELNTLSNRRIYHLINDKQVEKIRQSAQQIFSLC
jgi:CRISPR/Cas system CMR-associated protein Cmr3 (group 5 of RAMP superfamily)